MNRKYLTYTLDELLEDAGFIDFVRFGKDQHEWEVLFAQSEILRSNAQKARTIIETLKDNQHDISEIEINEIWKNIERYDSIVNHKQKRKVLYTVIRYAAVLLVLLSVGTTVWYVLSEKNKQTIYQFSQFTDIPGEGDARLILHNGEEFSLGKDNSKVEVGESGEIVINQEQIIYSEQPGRGNPSAMNEVVVPYGKKTELQLADGTKVWLNAGSRMAFPSEFTGKRREVYVEGEAYFEVAHMPSKPFYVQVRDITVRVLGTRFNLTAYAGESFVETVLLEGKVSLTDNSSGSIGKKETVLEPFQKASFSKGNRQFVIEPVSDADLYTAWTSGWFLFSQDNLMNVLRKLQRYYNVKIECKGDFSDDGLISGKLDLKDSLEQVMMALADVAGIEFRINENVITITKTINKLPVRR